MDMVSRCSRVEKIFNISLGAALRSTRGYEELRERISDRIDAFIRKPSRVYTARAVHRLAIKRYFEFLAS